MADELKLNEKPSKNKDYYYYYYYNGYVSFKNTRMSPRNPAWKKLKQLCHSASLNHNIYNEADHQELRSPLLWALSSMRIRMDPQFLLGES